jgi:hypothetical protein
MVKRSKERSPPIAAGSDVLHSPIPVLRLGAPAVGLGATQVTGTVMPALLPRLGLSA